MDPTGLYTAPMTRNEFFSSFLLAYGKCPDHEWTHSCDVHFAAFCDFITQHLRSVGLEGLQFSRDAAYSFYSQYAQFAGTK